MKYHILENIIAQITHEFTCGECHKKAQKKDIDILETSETYATFMFQCCSCNHSVVICAEAHEDNQVKTSHKPVFKHRALCSEDLEKVHKALQKDTTVSDLFRNLNSSNIS
jgi:hypothetical protein